MEWEIRKLENKWKKTHDQCVTEEAQRKAEEARKEQERLRIQKEEELVLIIS